MSTRERRLLRKQINLKLGYMSNKEAQENDYLNSSQMLTERQQMYMIIANQLRKSDNKKKSKKRLPFLVENSSFPHVNIARADRLLNSTKAILQNSEEIDKVIKAHSFRTATPYYTNPELTIERGNVPNYSQHLGALLHTPRYIDFLKTGCGSSRESQKSKAENKKSSETSERYSTSLDEFSSVNDSSSLRSSSTIKDKDKSRRSTFSFLPINRKSSSTSLGVSGNSKPSLSSIEKQESVLNSTPIRSPNSDTQDGITNVKEIVNFPIDHSQKSDETFQYSNSSQKIDYEDNEFERKSMHSSTAVSSKRESEEINIEYTNRNEDELQNPTLMSRNSSKKSYNETFDNKTDNINIFSPKLENNQTSPNNMELTIMISGNKTLPPDQNGQIAVNETIEIKKENRELFSPRLDNDQTNTDKMDLALGTSHNQPSMADNYSQKYDNETIEIKRESRELFSPKLDNDQTNTDKMDLALVTSHSKPSTADNYSQKYDDETIEIKKENRELCSPKLDNDQTHLNNMDFTLEISHKELMTGDKNSQNSEEETFANKMGSIEILSPQRDNDKILPVNMEPECVKSQNKARSSGRNSQTSFNEDLLCERKVSSTNKDNISKPEKESLSDDFYASGEEKIFETESDRKLHVNSHQNGLTNSDNKVSVCYDDSSLNQENKNKYVDERDSGDRKQRISTKLENVDLIVQLVNFLYDNNIDEQDFLSMNSFFETMNHFIKSRPLYVEDYRQFLAKSSSANFTLFADILNQNDIYEITDQQATEIKKILKDFKKHLFKKNNETGQNEIKAEENKKEEKDDILVETNENKVELVSGNSEKDIQKRQLEFEENEQIKNNIITENEIVDDYEKVENDIMIRKQSLEINDDNKSRESYDEDFSEEFHKLFRTSIGEITQDDIDEIKQLILEYQEYNKQDEVEEQNVDETDDFEFYQSFRDLFRKSVSDMNNEDVEAVQKLVEQIEESDENYLIGEDEDTNYKDAVVPFKRLFRASLGNISKADLENVKSTIADYQNPNTKHAINDRKFSMPNISENNKVVPFKALFRSSIGNIKEDDLEKISKIIEDHEKNMPDKVD